ncbi:MAG: hypothetical protein R3325_12580 [Thermoanaerobaculia bacterium]|nr:hypothetical protein [Thermoanaerobaculia bacterium]
MPQSHQQQQQAPEEPAEPDEAEERERQPEEDRKPALETSDPGVEDVPAVELSHGQQVQGGGEQPDPRGEGERMQVEHHAVGQRAMKETGEKPEEQRAAGAQKQQQVSW